VVARWAQHWNLAFADPAEFTHKHEVLVRHCADVGRDPAEITCSVQVALEPDADLGAMAEQADALGRAGVDVVIFSLRPPYRADTVASLAEVLRPLA
jgi:alkanesulfonate monooxygenase SsuD/methylene tetrahydromethanopterin reductase-like flavin-dependent oxidoreductase (luciferase family)